MSDVVASDVVTLAEREHVRVRSGGGFAFLLANGVVWIARGALTLPCP